MNLIQFLTMELHQRPVFIDGMVVDHSKMRSLQDESREGRQLVQTHAKPSVELTSYIYGTYFSSCKYILYIQSTCINI